MPVELSQEERIALKRRILKSTGSDLSSEPLSPDVRNEIKTAVLTPGTVRFAETSEGRREPTDIVDLGRGIAKAGGAVVEAFKNPETAARVGVPVAATILGGPEAGVAASAITPPVLEAVKLAKEGEPESMKGFMVDKVLGSMGPVGQAARLGIRVGNAVERDPNFFPPFTDDEKGLIQNDMGGLAILSQISRGRASDIAKRSLARSTVDTALELTGLAIARATSRGLRGGFTDVSPQAAEVIKTLRPIKGELNLAQLTESGIFDFSDKIARAGPFSRNAMDAFDIGTDAKIRTAMGEVIDNIITKVGKDLTREEITGLLQTTFDLGTVARKGLERTIFKQAFTRANEIGVFIPKSDIVGAAEKVTEKFGKQANIGFSPKLRREISKLKNLPPTIDFDSAHGIRSAFMTVGREAVEDPTLRKFAFQIANDIGDSMKVAAGADRELMRAWTRGNRLFRANKEVFEDDFVAKLFINNKKAAQAVGEAIYNNGNTEQIRKTFKWIDRAERLAKFGAKKKIVDPMTKAAVKSFDKNLAKDAVKFGYTRKFINKHFKPTQVSPLPGIKDPRRGLINWDSMLSDLGETKTKETMQLLFGKEHYRQFVEYAKAGQFLAAKSPGATGAWQLVQMGAASNVAKGAGGIMTGAAIGPGTKAVAIGTSLLGLPNIISWMLRSSKAIKFLTEGSKFMAKESVRRGGDIIGTALASAGRAVHSAALEGGKRLNPFTQPVVFGTDVETGEITTTEETPQ